jgi:hypothetical protein
VGGAHDGHINIGCWVLTGLLLFMIIEKVFPESNEEEDEHAVVCKFGFSCKKTNYCSHAIVTYSKK